MRVCIVGNGPSAEGHGAEIDACDFVIRIKAFWAFGAENAGERLDAVAWFGTQEEVWREGPVLTCNHWRTWSDEQYVFNCNGWPARRVFFEYWTQQTAESIVRLPHPVWERLAIWLGSHPSTGIVAVAMALHFLDVSELVLYGFDSTTLDRPNFHDARPPENPEINVHDTLEEKRAIARIATGRWLNASTTVKLTWPDKPEMNDEDITGRL